MRYYIILFFSVLCFFYGCNRSGVPEKIIPPDQMTALLTQVFITDGQLSNIQQFPDSLYKYGTGKYLAVFKKFDTDSAQFRKSCIYYSSDPKRMLDMNTKILAALQIKSDSLTKLLRNKQLKVNSFKPATVVGPHQAAFQHPVPMKNIPAPATHPVTTFHPGAAGPVVQHSATVLVHGHVMQTTEPMSPRQSLKAKQAILKSVKLKRDSIKAMQQR